MKRTVWILALVLALCVPAASAEGEDLRYDISDMGVILRVDESWSEAAQSGNVICYISEAGELVFCYLEDGTALNEFDEYEKALDYIRQQSLTLFTILRAQTGEGDPIGSAGEMNYYLSVNDGAENADLSDDARAVVSAVLACARQPESWFSFYEPARSDGSAFGPFSTQDIYGNPVDSSVFEGHKLTVVNIWGTYCGSCVSFMPTLAKLAQAYADKGVQFVGIVVDTVDSSLATDEAAVESARLLVEAKGAAYTHLLPDRAMMANKLSEVMYIPEMLVVDEHGVQIGESLIGDQSEETVVALIDALLSQIEAA